MKKILIVDDDKVVREMLESVLSRKGYVSVATSNAEKALETLDTTFNFVLTDLDLKSKNNHDGMWLVRQISAKFGKQIPVIMMSGLFTTDNVDEMEKYEVCYFLQKPFSIKELISVVRK